MSGSPSIQPPGRLQGIDALRGFALFGVIVVNAPFFAAPMGEVAIRGPVDQAAAVLLVAAFVGKFFLIFSFLFGFGFATALTRAATPEADLRGRFLRRLVALFAFGAAHAIFLFIGDILMLYALLGLVLWLCRGWSVRRLLQAAVAIGLAAVLVQVAAVALAAEAPPQPAAVAGEGYLGGFAEGVRARLADLPQSLGFVLSFNGVSALSMFLFGLAFGRAGHFPPNGRLLGRLRAPALWALGAGLLASGAGTLAAALGPTEAVQLAGLTGFSLAAPVLSFGLAVTALILAERWAETAPVRWLASVGRGSLSGYILHSILLGAVFYGWGFGLYGQLGLATVIGIGVLTYLAIAVLLNLWQRRFRYGPDEWLLRCFVDLRWKPLRKDVA